MREQRAAVPPVTVLRAAAPLNRVPRYALSKKLAVITAKDSSIQGLRDATPALGMTYLSVILDRAERGRESSELGAAQLRTHKTGGRRCRP
jgi:hypothetical protein